jgi:hypothetical protein
LKLVRNLNTLSNSPDYDKKYIVYWGYKYEDPTTIYQLNHEKNEIGRSLNIRKSGEVGRSSSVKKLPQSRPASTKKIDNEDHMTDIKTNLRT